MKIRFRGRFAAALALFAALFAGGASAQEEWRERPFREWTKAEAERVLSDSPWAHPQTIKVRFAGRASAIAGSPSVVLGAPLPNARAELRGAEAPVDFTFTLRLRSARPVREALVRLKQLGAGYDRMSAKDRAAFDARPEVRGLLECPACRENYVLTLTSMSKEERGADPVFTTYKGARLEDLRRYVYVSDDRGGRRPLVHFVPPKVPGDEAIFFFPRADERGAPLFTPESRELIFNLTEGSVNTATNFRVGVARLLAGGAVEF